MEIVILRAEIAQEACYQIISFLLKIIAHFKPCYKTCFFWQGGFEFFPILKIKWKMSVSLQIPHGFHYI